MNYMDERVYMLMNPDVKGKVEAFGVRLMSQPEFLVGGYFSWKKTNPRVFIHEMSRFFGEANFIALAKGFPTGFVCKMCVDVPFFQLLPETAPCYRKVRLKLLEIRASNPKPFLALSYNKDKQCWDYEPVLELSCVNSNYGFIPN